MKTIVALPGEGIGPEVVDATCELLMGTGLPLKILTPPQGSPLPEATKRAAREADGVLFGAAGPSTSPVVSWLRWEMAAWAGVRPIRFFPGMRSPLADPDGIDYVLLRENSEGLYPGREGELAELVKLMPNLADRTGRTVKDFGTEGRFAVKIVTPRGAERIARFACDLARRRQARGKPGKVTLVTKSNVLPRTDGLYDEIVGRIVREAGLPFEHFHVDDAARRLVRFPKAMDVVLCMNLYGDILSDLGAETAGGLGLAPSGNFGDGLGLLRIRPRLGARHRGQGHRESHRDDPVGGADAGAYGDGRRGAAARGRGGARLPRRPGADPRSGRRPRRRASSRRRSSPRTARPSSSPDALMVLPFLC